MDEGQAVRRATAGVVVGYGWPRRRPCMAWEAWTDGAAVGLKPPLREWQEAMDVPTATGGPWVVGVAKVQVERVLVVGTEVAAAAQAAPAAR